MSNSVFAMRKEHLLMLLRGIKYTAETLNEVACHGISKLQNAPQWVPIGFEDLLYAADFTLNALEDKERQISSSI